MVSLMLPFTTRTTTWRPHIHIRLRPQHPQQEASRQGARHHQLPTTSYCHRLLVPSRWNPVRRPSDHHLPVGWPSRPYPSPQQIYNNPSLISDVLGIPPLRLGSMASTKPHDFQRTQPDNYSNRSNSSRESTAIPESLTTTFRKPRLHRSPANLISSPHISPILTSRSYRHILLQYYT